MQLRADNVATTYRRTIHYEYEELEGELVVMERNTHALTTLNPAGRLVWDAIANPVSLADLEESFRQSFPDIKGDSMRIRIRLVLDALIAAGLAFNKGE